MWASVLEAAIPALTFTLLVAVGLDLTTHDFARLRRQPAVVVGGLAGPLLLLPPTAIGLTWIFRPDTATAAGLLLVSACPIGGISNTWSYLARASTALSVTLTSLSCLFAGVTMPLVGRAIAAAAEGADLFMGGSASVPSSVLVEFLVMLTAPVLVGMAIRRRWPAAALRHQPLVQRLAFLGVAGLITILVADNPRAFVAGLGTTVPLAVTFIACSAAIGWMLATALSRDPRDRFTLAAEFGTRNLGVSMLVAITLLGRIDFARFAFTYFLCEVPMMLAAVVWFRRRYAAVRPSDA